MKEDLIKLELYKDFLKDLEKVGNSKDIKNLVDRIGGEVVRLQQDLSVDDNFIFYGNGLFEKYMEAVLKNHPTFENFFTFTLPQSIRTTLDDLVVLIPNPSFGANSGLFLNTFFLRKSKLDIVRITEAFEKDGHNMGAIGKIHDRRTQLDFFYQASPDAAPMVFGSRKNIDLNNGRFKGYKGR